MTHGTYTAMGFLVSGAESGFRVMGKERERKKSLIKRKKEKESFNIFYFVRKAIALLIPKKIEKTLGESS